MWGRVTQQGALIRQNGGRARALGGTGQHCGVAIFNFQQDTYGEANVAGGEQHRAVEKETGTPTKMSIYDIDF